MILTVTTLRLSQAHPMSKTDGLQDSMLERVSIPAYLELMGYTLILAMTMLAEKSLMRKEPIPRRLDTQKIICIFDSGKRCSSLILQL
ncbi:hypothetical protein A4H96_08185 [Acidithiobacillus ferrooxidans]|uniref:Uncharacterized protein n=1 Tax=Acidithiobacillus ferrooxidans TaxID=920 RepID=A0A179BIG3_ACIFR|nr:hypothetical protein A4H96_08185 [Acidithiobacillus ferrooxidans]